MEGWSAFETNSGNHKGGLGESWMADKLRNVVLDSDTLQAFISVINRRELPRLFTVRGLAGSSKSVILAALQEVTARQIAVIAQDRESAERLNDDLCALSGLSVRVFSGRDHSTSIHPDRHRSVENVETLKALLAGDVKLVVITPDALVLPLPAPASLSHKTFILEVGIEYDFSAATEKLAALGFQKEPFVQTCGEYSVRGGIVDIYPYVGENPVRVEFSGEMIESIREFDPLSQRSIRELTAAAIVPDLLASAGDGSPEGESRSSLLDFLATDALLVLEEPEVVRADIEKKTAKQIGGFTWDQINEHLSRFLRVHIQSLSQPSNEAIDFQSTLQPSFNASIRHLRGNLAELQTKDFRVVITCDGHAEQTRLRDLLLEVEDIAGDTCGAVEAVFDGSKIEYSIESLHEGFILPDLKLAVYTEHQIFNRLKRRGKRRRPKFKGFTDREIQQLRRGDYVVHMDYGIGTYDGLKKIRVSNVEQEVVKLLYAENDTLYVNLNYVNRLQMYASKEGHVPKLTKLGGAEWDRLKAKAKKRIKDIARDLIQLYARRKRLEGFAFEPDTPWQKELEASFLYEDTFDQAKATREVKHDMESTHPMDRLICGDVGFGKTEVAVRAAFKTVMSGKQVAVLVPTTILAVQHYNTFLDRLSRYPVRIQMISRFRSKKQQAEIVEELKSGAIDVIIGTHRLLSNDIGLKDLGLLVIDEEHRFGVTAKERLRQLKSEVDTLTLTATPIPRTLHFSLMGARDLSIIATPPRNRLPIITEVTQYDEDLIREAIVREVQRYGQVYFVHDRVQTIEGVTQKLQSILPGVRLRHAHGQMVAHQLENVMIDFLEKRFDVLVCTKIIESGLDIPNVNTIIINRADRFGMAELYQLRGRVGRSNIQAYAYLITPPISIVPKGTIERLQALEEHTDLGSGFHLAMRDLEIRGAGNLLGSEQSGFIESMGFETYTRILDEAVAELKEQEFKELFEEKDRITGGTVDTVVEAELDAFVPESYVENADERLTLYRRLYGVRSSEQLHEIANEMNDRFGRHPAEVENLLGVVEIKLAAGKVGFRRVSVTSDRVEIQFPPETETPFYEGEGFQEMMERISQMRNQGAAMRQDGKALRLEVPLAQNEIGPLQQSLEIIARLSNATYMV